MGWWRAHPETGGFAMEETGLVWGDGPADIMSDAISKIIQEFIRECGRKPTEEELKLGLIFSAGTQLED